MNEKNKMLILLSIVVVIIIIAVTAFMASLDKGKELVDEFMTKFEGDKPSVVYIGSPDCGYCNQFNPIIAEVNEEHSTTHLYINVKEMTTKNLNLILEKLGVDPKELATPYIAIVKGGKVIDKNEGLLEKDALEKMYVKNGIIDKMAKSYFNEVSYNEYEKLIKDGKKHVIAVVQTGCGACTEAKPIIKEIANENKQDMYFLNLSNLKEDEYEKFGSSIKEFSGKFGTPYVIVAQNSKVIDKIEGLTTKEEYEKLFKNNGFLK